MKALYWMLLVALVGFVMYISVGLLNPIEPKQIASLMSAAFTPPDGFQRAESPRQWIFPPDYGPHPDYQTEWWYYTGNLESDTGERFGYQLTLFRRGLLPTQERIERESALASDQVYMAHLALSDITAKEHYGFERFARGAAGLAGAQAELYQVWLENWSVKQITENKFELSAQQGEIVLDLTLEDTKGPILHGLAGYSQKGPEPGNASHYYSQTRLLTTGRVKTARGIYYVEGWSWKDHEFSTSALSAGQVGWDWFSIQLDDGSELMVFQIRREDGSSDPFSSGTWISQDGETTHLDREDFNIRVRDTWRSPHSGAEYPAAWQLEIPKLELSLTVEPYLADQEMRLSYTYWEGAVKVSGMVSGAPVSGHGYVEMTGYAASMEGQF